VECRHATADSTAYRTGRTGGRALRVNKSSARCEAPADAIEPRPASIQFG
jgi:hypothetical protein